MSPLKPASQHVRLGLGLAWLPIGTPASASVKARQMNLTGHNPTAQPTAQSDIVAPLLSGGLGP